MRFRTRWTFRVAALGSATAIAVACTDGTDDTGGSGGSGTVATGDLVRPGDPIDATMHRALVAIGSCLFDDGMYRTLTGYRGRQGGFNYMPLPADCLAAVTDGCDGVLRCVGMEFDLAAVSGDTVGQCEGNTLDLGAAGVWRCDGIGFECREGTCAPPAGELCDIDSQEGCDAEGRPVHCDDYLQVGPRCADFGLVCSDEGFDVACAGTGEACEGETSPYFAIDPVGVACVDDQTLQACLGGGMADVDCATLGEGFRCQEAQGAFFCGLGSECDPRTFGAPCEGNEVTFCDAGVIERVDCTSLGFDGCEETSESILCATVR